MPQHPIKEEQERGGAIRGSSTAQFEPERILVPPGRDPYVTETVGSVRPSGESLRGMILTCSGLLCCTKYKESCF